MTKPSKAETFIGFAVRARKLRTGANTLSALKKANLIIVCRTASDNAKENAVKYAAKYRCPLLVTADKDLSEIIRKDNVKVAAITDFALAKAINDNAAPTLTGLLPEEK